jgi:hypothetical protein
MSERSESNGASSAYIQPISQYFESTWANEEFVFEAEDHIFVAVLKPISGNADWMKDATGISTIWRARYSWIGSTSTACYA